MKVSELDGRLLDYWVAKANNERETGSYKDFCHTVLSMPDERKFSADWSLGGPIIERERIMIYPQHCPDGAATTWTALHDPTWRYDEPKSDVWIEDAPTALIAAMRCFVASKFGETVEG